VSEGRERLAVDEIGIPALKVSIGMQQTDHSPARNDRGGNIRTRQRGFGNGSVDAGLTLDVGDDDHLPPPNNLGFEQAWRQSLGLLLADTVDHLGPLRVVSDEDPLGDPDTVENAGNDRPVEAEVTDQPRQPSGSVPRQGNSRRPCWRRGQQS
jgi:hypothetical protein